MNKVTPSTVDVSWLPLDTTGLNSKGIYGYLVQCLNNFTSDILMLNFENASSFNTVVRNLRPYMSYKVKVIALVSDIVTGEITLKTSKKIDIRTHEDGKDFTFVLICRFRQA